MTKVTECKTMFARMENVKLGKLDEMGVGINDVEKALDRVDIPLRDSVDSFRSMEDVMGDIAEKWDTLTEVEQASLSTTIAGVRQRENFLVLMQNWEQSLELQKIQFESAGLAADRYDIYLQNLEASSNRLTASWEELWNETIEAEAIIFFQDLVSSVLEFAAALGGLVPILTAALGYIVTSKAPIVLDLINKQLFLMGVRFRSIGLSKGFLSLFSPQSAVLLAVYAWTVAIQKFNKLLDESKKSAGSVSDQIIKNTKEVASETESAGAAYRSFLRDIKNVNSEIDKAPAFAKWWIKTFNSADMAKDSIKGLSDSIVELVDDYDEYERIILRAMLATGQLTVAEENLVNASLQREELTSFQITQLDRLLSGVEALSEAELKTALYGNFNPEIMKYGISLIDETSDSIGGMIEQYEGLSDILKTLQSEGGTIADIVGKAMAGEVTFDDIQKLAEIYPDYLDALSVENGLIKINTDLLGEYNTQKAEEALADARARLALDETNESLQKEVMLLENYVEQTERAIPISRDFVDAMQDLFLRLEDVPEEMQGTIDQISNLSEQFQDGKLDAIEYFEALEEQVTKLADMNISEMLGEDGGAQGIFSGLVLNATQALAQISSEFDARKIPINEYTDQLVELSDVIVGLGTTYADSDIPGANDAISASIDTVIEGQKELAGLQDLNNALMGETWIRLDANSEEYIAYSKIVAEAAWKAAEESGKAFLDIEGNAYTSMNGMFQDLLLGDQNFNNIAQQSAERTGDSIGKITGGIGVMLTEIGNAISSFDISLSVRAVPGDMVSFPIKAFGKQFDFLEIPSFSFDIGADGNMASVASRIGGAISTFGTVLSGLQDNDFGADIYAPLPPQVPGGFAGGYDDVTDSINDAIDATLDLASATGDLNDQIEDLRKSAQDTLKDQLKGYKDLIDQQKSLLKLKDKEREYQNDVDDKQKDILHIQAEIDELKFDDTQEAIARRLALEADLASQERDLEDLQQKHSTDIQIAALDAEYAQFERSIQAKIDAIELIDATSIDDFIMKLQGALATSASVPMYHSGVDAGFVGGKSVSMGNEQFAKLMSGELVINPDQMNKFMNYTLPKMTQVSSDDMMGGMSFENLMSIVVQGNLDPDVLPKLEKIATQVVEKINKDMSNRGYKRNASSFSI